MKVSISAILVIFTLLLPIMAMGQTVIPVAEGTDQISAAIATAQAGDIIELSTDGGVYNESAGIVVDKVLIIRAAAGLTNKPVISADDTLAVIVVGADFTLNGIYLDGALGANPTAFGILVANGTMGYTLTVENCEIWDFGTPDEQGSGINGVENSSWPTQAESVSVINCIFGRMEGEHIRFTRSPDGVSQPGPLKDLYVYGSTFWGQGVDEAIYVITDDSGSSGVDDNDPLFFVDHCTFVNVGGKGIYPKYIGGAIIQNSICVGNDGYAARIYGLNSSIFNMLWFNCPDGISFYAGANESTQGVNILNEDPLFVDADYLNSGDFTLADNSPAVGQADDGKTLGDPRWWPGATGVESGQNSPSDFSLSQNYPNPFNPETSIEFSIKSASRVTLTIYNVSGQKVATLLDQNKAAGTHNVSWHAGSRAAGGIYFYKLSVNGHASMRKMALLK
ncbi:T9SS type A sorting domain-containing protein [bacterium]|nr:T9SS type A sorting domain-containing protein [bacterium]